MAKIDPREVEARVDVWKKAAELVDPLLERFPLTSYPIGVIFSQTARTTEADQAIYHIIDVANWLIEKD